MPRETSGRDVTNLLELQATRSTVATYTRVCSGGRAIHVPVPRRVGHDSSEGLR